MRQKLRQQLTRRKARKTTGWFRWNGGINIPMTVGQRKANIANLPRVLNDLWKTLTESNDRPDKIIMSPSAYEAFKDAP